MALNLKKLKRTLVRFRRVAGPKGWNRPLKIWDSSPVFFVSDGGFTRRVHDRFCEKRQSSHSSTTLSPIEQPRRDGGDRRPSPLAPLFLLTHVFFVHTLRSGD